MLYDIRLLLWLRVRHARTALVRLVHAGGTDLVEDRGPGERAYQLYLAAIAVVWAALMWAALLDATAAAFAAVGPASSAMALTLGLLAPVTVFAWAAVRALRTSPVKLARADIPFVAAGPWACAPSRVWAAPPRCSGRRGRRAGGVRAGRGA